MTDRPAVTTPLDLHRALTESRGPGVRKCASSVAAECEERAISDVRTAMHRHGLSVRALALIVHRDESTVRDWLIGGRKKLPAWLLYALPEPVKTELLRIKIDGLKSGTDG